AAGRPALERGAKAEALARVRRRIVQALAEADAEGGRAALRRAAADPDPRVRAAAAEGLGELSARQGAKTLARLAATDASDAVRAAALCALVACEAPSAREHLTRALAWPSHGEEVRATAIEQLAELGDASVVPDLLPFVTRPWSAPGAERRLTMAALDTLARLAPTDARVVAAARARLTDPYPAVRAAAASALGEMPRAEAGAALLERLGVESVASVKAALAAALRRLAGSASPAEAEDAPAASAPETADALDARAAALAAEAQGAALDAALKRLEAEKLRVQAKTLRERRGR
ncbi:MAG: HEAT repeat domain-containing protein, partial [Planctomycetes bacterium]|nr:HEAT repeat domain-containing protein [Planctomycetota bacterium]